MTTRVRATWHPSPSSTSSRPCSGCATPSVSTCRASSSSTCSGSCIRRRDARRLVGGALDGSRFEEVAGTIAGDDTVLVIARSRPAAQRLLRASQLDVRGGRVSERERCVLAYSGGLDTSVAIRWLQEELGYDVITLTADLGEFEGCRFGCDPGTAHRRAERARRRRTPRLRQRLLLSDPRGGCAV